MTRIELPMTLIEGHARVLVEAERGEVVAVRFQGMDTRFFETFLVGQLVNEVPRLTPMICGVCSATHHVASAKALDDLVGVDAPPGAWRVRDMVNYGIHLNNQAMHLLALGLPDFLPEEQPRRSMVGLMKARPEMVRAGVELMELGFEVVSVFGGRDVHPVNAIPGGVARPPDPAEVERLRAKLRGAGDALRVFVGEALDMLQGAKDKIASYRPGYRYMLAMRGPGYNPTHGEPLLRGPDGDRVFPDRGPGYLEALEEHAVEYSYIRMVSARGRGLRDGAVNTGALARLNLRGGYGVPMADEVVDEARSEFQDLRLPLLSHYARLAEVAALYDIILGELAEPFGGGVSEPRREEGEGVGVIEAPRGMLIHHFRAREGRLTYANIITPTAVNAAAIEADLEENLRGVDPGSMEPGELYKRVAALVRAYDPCMACATHAATERACIDIVVVDRETGEERVVRHG